MQNCTIGEIADRFGLSRSTLLYYDQIGLLSPSGRSAANYRLYGRKDLERMQQIVTFRAAGIPLLEIKRLLKGDAGRLTQILEERLAAINREIAGLREQQQVIVQLLKNNSLLRKTRVLDKQSWVTLLRSTGLDEEAMQRWHVEFERMSPLAHQDFLEGLGIAKGEIDKIRRWSREMS